MKVEIEKNLLKDIERCPEGGGGQVEKQQADVDAVVLCCAVPHPNTLCHKMEY